MDKKFSKNAPLVVDCGSEFPRIGKELPKTVKKIANGPIAASQVGYSKASPAVHRLTFQ